VTAPQRFADADACARAIVRHLSGQIRLALPLGLGKPARLANALYRLACSDPAIELSIYTALTLERPRPQSELERRLLDPIVERLYRDVPELEYAVDLRRKRLPPNVRVEEFYFRPGAYLGLPSAQQNYTSINYTHAARVLLARGVNVVAQMVAPAPGHELGNQYSLSCNPDVGPDLLDLARQRGAALPLLVGEVNPALPFMARDAELGADQFTMLLESDATRYSLFPVPNRDVSLAEHVIALRVSTLIRDGGSLQIGIGSLGDAVAHAIGLRRRDNARFRALIEALGARDPGAQLDDFPTGLYGVSEMFVEGFLHLHGLGIMRRTVEDGIYLHAGFYLGSAGFYAQLRQLPPGARQGINMTRISFTNNLLGDEDRKRQQRQHARFVNSAMMVTLLGATVSDALEDGRVVSGVGGQHNFVAMAHELEGARSIIALPATRVARGKLTSNVVWSYGHMTIPRHLRDVVVTEYGVADLRGATDRQVIERMLNLADSRFQEPLRRRAVAAGKLPAGYQIPERHRRNTPQALHAAVQHAGLLSALPLYPLGTDFTDEEAELAAAMAAMGRQRGNPRALCSGLLLGWRHRNDPRLRTALQRLGLDAPRGCRAHLYRLLLAAALMREIHLGGRPLFARHDDRSAATD